MLKKLLLIDFNNLYNRGKEVHSSLEFNGHMIGGFYGFVQQLSTAINELEPTVIVSCSDSPPYLRKKYYSAYKEGRPMTDATNTRINLRNKRVCRLFLEFLGIRDIMIKGLEADDIIAYYCRLFKDEGISFILSNDSDLYQLLSPKVMLYKGESKGGLFTSIDFKKRYPGITASDWIDVLALSGGHNNLSRIKNPNNNKNIGEKTALKIVRKEIDSKFIALVYSQNEVLISRNKMLIELPFPKFRLSQFITGPPKNLLSNKRLAEALLYKYGIKQSKNITSMLKRF